MDSSNTNNLLQEKSNRIFFLKAILLGIQYSESGKADELKNTIQQELSRLTSNSSNQINQTNVTTPMTLNNTNNNFIMNNQQTLQKYEQILHELNNQKLTIANKISNISSQSYMKTLSLTQSQQIQKELFNLRKMVLVINKEIEKYSLLHQSVFKMIQQPKVSPQENIMKKNNVKNYLNPSSLNQQSNDSSSNQSFFYHPNQQHNQQQNQQENKQSFENNNLKKNKSVSFFPPDNNTELEEDNSPSSNFSNNNELNSNTNSNNDDEEDNDSNDLLKELQKTFGNLSSLLNSS